jgi:hypothetical protein
MNDAAVFGGRPGEARQHLRIRTQGRIEEELVDRRKFRRQRIERLLGPRRMAQGAERGCQIAIAVLDRAQTREGGKRGIARRFQRGADGCEALRPVGEPCARGLQGVFRRADCGHQTVEIGRVQVTCNEGERLKRCQQRRQQGHDIVDHGLAHRAFR